MLSPVAWCFQPAPRVSLATHTRREAEVSLDRTQFKKQTFQEADMQYGYWKSKSIAERLRAAYYLISVAYDFDLQKPPGMDKTAFSMRKHNADV